MGIEFCRRKKKRANMAKDDDCHPHTSSFKSQNNTLYQTCWPDGGLWLNGFVINENETKRCHTVNESSMTSKGNEQKNMQTTLSSRLCEISDIDIAET